MAAVSSETSIKGGRKTNRCGSDGINEHKVDKDGEARGDREDREDVRDCLPAVAAFVGKVTQQLADSDSKEQQESKQRKIDSAEQRRGRHAEHEYGDSGEEENVFRQRKEDAALQIRQLAIYRNISKSKRILYLALEAVLENVASRNHIPVCPAVLLYVALARHTELLVALGMQVGQSTQIEVLRARQPVPHLLAVLGDALE